MFFSWRAWRVTTWGCSIGPALNLLLLTLQLQIDYSACFWPNIRNPGFGPHANFFFKLVMEESKVKKKLGKQYLTKDEKIICWWAGDYNARIHIGWPRESQRSLMYNKFIISEQCEMILMILGRCSTTTSQSRRRRAAIAINLKSKQLIFSCRDCLDNGDSRGPKGMVWCKTALIIA